MRLKNKVAVVTGASSGMGKAIVETFVREGASVVAVARRKERLEELAASLEDAEGKIAIYPADITVRENVEAMIDFAAETFGAFDVLVNNAGIMDDMSGVGDATDERYEQVMKVNLYGPMAAMRKAVNYFKENEKPGNIINVTSLGALHSCAGALYCASKAALVSMTQNTAFMYMSDHIRCNSIAPGGVATEISASMGVPNMAGYARVQKVLACNTETIGQPQDIANVALFLASDESNYVSGVTMPVDGGWNAM